MQPPRVLFVDDEPSLLNGIRRVIRTGFELRFAESGSAALAILKSEPPFAAIVSDMRMPVMSGVEFLETAATIAPDTTRIMLTGNADQQTAVDAVNRGNIFRFLNKPCQAAALVDVLKSACRQYELVTAERVLMEQTLAGMVRLLVEVLNNAYPAVFARSQLLRDLVRAYAQPLGGRLWILDMAAMLSEVGWLTLPHDLVQRSLHGEPLTEVEREMVANVHVGAARMLRGIPRLEELARLIAPEPTDSASSDAQVLALLRTAAENVQSQRLPLTKILAQPLFAGIEIGLVGKLKELAQQQPLPSADVSGGETVSERIDSISQLRLGDYLTEDLIFESGELAIGKGMTINEFLLEKLINLGRLRRLKLPIRAERRAIAATVAKPVAA